MKFIFFIIICFWQGLWWWIRIGIQICGLLTCFCVLVQGISFSFFWRWYVVLIVLYNLVNFFIFFILFNFFINFERIDVIFINFMLWNENEIYDWSRGQFEIWFLEVSLRLDCVEKSYLRYDRRNFYYMGFWGRSCFFEFGV